MLAIVSVLVIASLTLFPTSDRSAGLTLCLFCGDRGLADAILNVLLFMPLGAGLALRGATLLAATLLGGVFTGGIEFLQSLIPGRDASLSDLLFNTLGCVLGAALLRSAPAWIDPGPGRARRLLAGALVLPLLLLVAGGLLLSPRPSRDVYAGQWTAELGHLESYRGRVTSAYVGEVHVPSRQMRAESERLRVLLEEGAPVRVSAVAGPPVPALAPIFSIYDDEEREIVLLGADREDAVFQFRTVGLALGMDRPSLRLPGAFHGVRPGDPLRMEVARAGRGYCFSVNAARSCAVGFTVTDTWRVFLALSSLGSGVRGAIGLAWLAALWVPAGFWIRGRRQALLAAASVATGLLLVPPVAGLLPTPLPALAAALVGLGVGALARRMLRRNLAPRELP
ncbi:MAG TPA: VanZ family protein [Longimicrobiaceae bacterium]|nr:VanZ family protein [Longimicrobiaceae bacterium]